MLYEIIISALVGLVVGAYCGVKTYRIGFNDAQRTDKGLEVIKPKAKKKNNKKTAQIAKFDKILENIDRYDGTSDGQEDLDGRKY